MARDTETAFVGRANTIKRVLRRQGSDLGDDDRLAVTRVTANFGAYCLDTDVGADPITYDSDTGAVAMQIGLVPNIEPGRYDLTLTVFDAETPEGFAWGSFRVSVVEWATCDA